MDEYDDPQLLFNDYINEKLFEKNKYIIITGGIGDFIALDYIYQFSVLNNIIFISSQSLRLRNLLKDINILKNKFFAVYFDFKIINQPGFDNNEQLYNYFPLIKKYGIKVINISDYFEIIKKNMPYINNFGCAIINKINIQNIKTKFNLPDNLVFISPFTEDNRVNCIKCKEIHTFLNKNNCLLTRNFLHIDYLNTINFLKNNNLVGVIISSNNIVIPEDLDFDENLLINLSSKTTLLESIEILKISKIYVGIDGLFSIVASKIFTSNNIFIKANNRHLYDNKDIYYFPKKLNVHSFISFE